MSTAVEEGSTEEPVDGSAPLDASDAPDAPEEVHRRDALEDRDPRARRRRQRRYPSGLVRLAVAVSLPILAATVMVLHDGWTPVGDNATLALRAGDVLRGDPPLTGMPTTADTISGTKDLDHPGPLEVWVAAVPYRVFGPAGMILTVAAVNIAALIAAVAVGWRRGGQALAVGVTAISLLLCWSLGSTIIRDPLNSHTGLLPWFALVLLAWDVRLGRWRSLPLAVAAACWVTQVHVVYLIPTAVLAIGTALLTWRDLRRATPEVRRRHARGRRRGLIWAMTVGLLLNLPLLLDQLFGSGNLGQLLGFGGRPGEGPAFAIRALVSAFGFPPAWMRHASDPFLLIRGPDLADLLAFMFTVGITAWAIAVARSREDRRALSLLQGSLLALFGVALVIVRTPVHGAVLAADPMFILRPTTAAVWLAVGWSLWRGSEASIRASLSATWAKVATATVASLLALGLVAATLFAPARFGGFGEGLMEPASFLERRVLPTVAAEPLVQVNASGWAARLYLRQALVERLEREGVRTRTGDEERALRRGGDERGQPTATIWIVSDPEQPEPPEADAVLIASSDLVRGGSLSEVARRREELRRQLDDAGRIELRSTRELSVDDISTDYFRWETPPPDGNEGLPADWVSVDAFVDLARNGLVASPDIDPDLIEQVAADNVGRYFASEDTEVAVYLRQEPS